MSEPELKCENNSILNQNLLLNWLLLFIGLFLLFQFKGDLDFLDYPIEIVMYT